MTYLNEVTGSDVNQDVMRILKSGGNVKWGGEGNGEFAAVRTEREIVEGGGSDLEASGGGADVGEAVLEEIHF